MYALTQSIKETVTPQQGTVPGRRNLYAAAQYARNRYDSPKCWGRWYNHVVILTTSMFLQWNTKAWYCVIVYSDRKVVTATILLSLDCRSLSTCRWRQICVKHFSLWASWHLPNGKYLCNLAIMTSSNGNIFRVTGHLSGEFTGPGEFPTQRPVTWSFDVFFDLRLNKRLSKQPWGWWFETPSWSLWCHCNGIERIYASPSLNELSEYMSWTRAIPFNFNRNT